MGFRDDERAAAIQVGAVILLGFVVTALTLYQITVVPSQNADVEYNHNQKVQQELQAVGNAIDSVPGGNPGSSVSVSLGTTYPARSVFVNPPSPAGTLQTVGTARSDVNVTVANAVAAGETGHYWNGTNRSFGTGGIVYEPDYSQYDGAPRTVYANTMVYNLGDGNEVVLADQNIVDGRTITLVTLNGSLDETRSGSYSVDARAVSTSTRTVRVTNTTGGNVTLRVPTLLSEQTWADQLADEERVANHTVVSGPGRYDVLVLELDRLDGSGNPQTYTLRMAKVGVGSDVETEPSDTYLTTVDDFGSVRTGETREFTVEVRDGYNNPVGGVLVNASAENGTVTPADDTSDDDGRVTFVYEAPSSVPSGGNDTISANISASPDRDEEVNFTASVSQATGTGGGNGAYDVTWWEPSNANVTTSGASVSCSQSPPDGACTLDAGGNPSVDVEMWMYTDPPADGANVSLAVSNKTVATVSPGENRTDATGQSMTTLTVDTNGTVTVYATSGAGGDRLALTVTNMSSMPSMADNTSKSGTPQAGGGGKELKFDIQSSSRVQITDFAILTQNDLSGISELTKSKVEIKKITQDGSAEPPKGNEYSTDGTVYGFNTTAIMDSGPGEVKIKELDPKITVNGYATDESSADIVVTLVFSDGSEKEVYIDAQ